jgi:hypothetical protein
MTEVTDDIYVVEDGESDELHSLMTMSADDDIPPDPTGGGGSPGTNSPPPAPPNIRNYAKYSQQIFSLLDTNSLAAGADTNLYTACAAMPVDTNTVPMLFIRQYGPNAAIIRADNFDYSETNADFALLVCDKVETPTWKTIDFGGASDAQDGWLVQGTVPNSQVSTNMFMLITNINLLYPAFFRAIPYSGPQIAINGDPQPYDVVSNTITLNAQILDLSGTTNEQFSVVVDDDVARYGFGTTNSTISLDTKYNVIGLHNVYLSGGAKASVYDPINAPDNTKLLFNSSASVPLDFENDTYLLFASDYAPPEIGTNYFYYSVNKAQDVAGIILDLSDGDVVLAFTNYVPYATTLYFGWNFTEADGVTPYTNDTYVVHFIAFDPADIINTNTIDREGVRPGTGCYLTYEEENPVDPDGGDVGNYLNQSADTWINQNLKFLYTDLYDGLGLTMYDSGQVGAARAHSDCQPLDSGHVEWSAFMQPALASLINVGTNTWSTYSDLTIAQAHGNGATVGGGHYLQNTFTPTDLKGWLMAAGTNWRLRKANVWTCYSGDILLGPNRFNEPLDFGGACGIRGTTLQSKSYMRKNVGLFFAGLLPQVGFGGSFSVTTAQVAAAFDQAWVCGPNAYPGDCDPTYSFDSAAQSVVNQYPELGSFQAAAVRFGYPLMIYSSAFDDELMMLNTTHVKQ